MLASWGQDLVPLLPPLFPLSPWQAQSVSWIGLALQNGEEGSLKMGCNGCSGCSHLTQCGSWLFNKGCFAVSTYQSFKRLLFSLSHTMGLDKA